MAEAIVVRVRPDLQKAKQQASELQRKQQQIERQRQEGRREEARAARRPVTTARREREPGRRGRLGAGAVAAGSRVKGLSGAAIAAALAAAGVTVTSQFLLPMFEFNAVELGKLLGVPGLGKKLSNFIGEQRRALEELKVFMTSSFAAVSQTRESLNGAAILGAQIADVDVTGTFQARRRVAYLREASRAVVQSDLGANAIKGILKGMSATLQKNVAGRK